jgi:hypothetical protein
VPRIVGSMQSRNPQIRATGWIHVLSREATPIVIDLRHVP